MNSGQDPFEVLRKAGDKPIPTTEERKVALGRLQHAIKSEEEKTKRSGSRWRWGPIAAVAAALAILVIAIPPLVVNPARAALIEIADAARRASPVEVPEGDFIYSRSEHKNLAIRPGEDFGLPHEFVGYLLPTIREVWRNPADQFILIHTTVGNPEFFDPQTEATYYTAGLDEADQIGQTFIEQFTSADDPVIETEWPTQADPLRDAMESFIIANRNQTVDTAQIFDLAADILRETHPSPELRSAVLQVLGMEAIDLEEQTSTSVTVSHAETGRGTAITLSNDGHLLAETTTLVQPDPELGIPEGTIISSGHYGKTRIVDKPPHT